MEYTLGQRISVRSTRGMTGVEDGLVKIVGMLEYEAVDASYSSPYLADEEELDERVIEAKWLVFRYVDEMIHESMGIMYIPDFLMDDIRYE